MSRKVNGKFKSLDVKISDGLVESSDTGAAISCSGTSRDDVTHDVIVTSQLLDRDGVEDDSKHFKIPRKVGKSKGQKKTQNPKSLKRSFIVNKITEVKKDSDVICPCCDVINDAETTDHVVVFVDSDLCVIDAMNERRHFFERQSSGASATRGARSLHDDRLCLKLTSCQKNYRQNTSQPDLIDPTRYFKEESLGKLKDATLYAKYGFDNYTSDVEIDETESESEESKPRNKCPCCDNEKSGDFEFEHLVFTCDRRLGSEAAMNERNEAVRRLGDPHTMRMVHGIVRTYHDERCCSQLPTCFEYRNKNKGNVVDPTFGFKDEWANNAKEENELQKYVKSETTKIGDLKYYGKFRLENSDWVVVTRAVVENALYPTDPEFKLKTGAGTSKMDKTMETIDALLGIRYDLPKLRISKPKKSVKRNIVESEKVGEFCPCCDQNTLEFAPGLKYAHSQFVVPRTLDPRAALKAREAFMVKETLEVRREFQPQKVRVTIHDERICAGLESCHEFQTQDSDIVDPTRYFTDLKRNAKGLHINEISSSSIEPEIDFENLRCPCCERDEVHEDLDHGFEHIQYHVPETLSLQDAIMRRHRFTETYESPQRFYRPVQLNFHDERLCLKLDKCLKDLCKEENGFIDPTRYFTDKRLGKYESLMLKELRVNKGVRNEGCSTSLGVASEKRGVGSEEVGVLD